MKGGYLLNRKPQEISLGAVVRALGKVPTITEICDRFTGNRSSCIHIDECCIRSAWETLTHSIQAFLDQTSLSELTGTEAKTRLTFGHRIEV
jgi:DNA-binding IscR family transcriptional regulator